MVVRSDMQECFPEKFEEGFDIVPSLSGAWLDKCLVGDRCHVILWDS